MKNNEEDFEELEKERKIISESVMGTRDEIEGILDDYTVKMIKDSEAKNNAITEIIEFFLKILYRINRFSEFKSKFRVLKVGEKISKKELERCKIVIKLKRNKDEIIILKNDLSEEIGTFRKKN